jgi:hypothetical protein
VSISDTLRSVIQDKIDQADKLLSRGWQDDWPDVDASLVELLRIYRHWLTVLDEHPTDRVYCPGCGFGPPYAHSETQYSMFSPCPPVREIMAALEGA